MFDNKYFNTHWKTLIDIETEESDGYSYVVDYSEELKAYRVSVFKDNHWKDEIFFDEVKYRKEL